MLSAERSPISRRLNTGVAIAASLVVAVALAITGASAAHAQATPTIARISGTDRYDTSVKLAKSRFPNPPIVFIATGQNYPDALAAGAIAAHLDGPLILTQPTALPSGTATYLQGLHPAKVVIVGGTSAVSNAVQSQLATLMPGAAITRLAGTDRYDTGRKVVEYGYSSVSKIFVATGANYPDALSAAAAGGAKGSPVVLVNGTAASVDSATRSMIASLGVHTAVIVGGTAAVSAGIATSLSGISGVTSVSRLAGADRFDTSQLIAKSAFTTPTTRAYLATGYGFADALSGSAVAGQLGSPLFTVQTDCVPQSTLNEMTALGVEDVTLIGGTGALTVNVASLTSCAPPAASVTTLWTSTAPHLTSGDSSFWRATDCVDGITCVAVGSVFDTTSHGLITQRSSAGTWSSIKAPLPIGAWTASYLYDVSCTVTTSCAAVGAAYAGSSSQRGIVDTLTQTGWTSQTIPLPSGVSATVSAADSIACGSPTSCVVTAGYESPSDHAYFAMYDGTSWTTAVPPLPSGASGAPNLQDVACVREADCYAIGSLNNLPVISHWNGTAWTAQYAPLPSGVGSSNSALLNSISCDLTGLCAIQASYDRGDGAAAGFMEVLTDTTWSASKVATPAGAGHTPSAFMGDVSCAGGSCTAVGDYEVAGGGYAALAQRWNGSGWVQTILPVPSGADVSPASDENIALNSVSCFGAGSCVASGAYKTSTVEQGLIARYANGSWSLTTSTAQSSNGISNNYDVACATTGLCVIANSDTNFA